MPCNLKIFVACHKRYFVPECDRLIPIQTGAALSDERLDGCIRDDDGDNISEKNRSYCELTAQYYARKNVNADYYGFFHYRRYLNLSEKQGKRPYIVLKNPTDKTVEKYGLTSFDASDCDIIVPRREDMFISVYEYYKRSANHRIKDLELALEIIDRYHPEYSAAAKKYLGGTVAYFCNMYIMKRELFFDYCDWLFDILGRFEGAADKSGYNNQEMRVEGFLAERLFGIYLTRLSEDGGIRLREVQRIDFLDDGFVKGKIKYIAAPPESARRRILKKILKY